jgi:hypothetical protein
MAVQAEAALVLTMRLAQLLGRLECGVAGQEETLLFRLASSLVKLYTARQAVAGASETIEAFGGAGYMEDTGIARILRDAQVLSIWEGTTNVLSLDALRVLAKPGVADAFLAELARLDSPSLGKAQALMADLVAMPPDTAQRHARRLSHGLTEAWLDGLLTEAAGRGEREAQVAEVWLARGEPTANDAFDQIVDGTPSPIPA